MHWQASKNNHTQYIMQKRYRKGNLPNWLVATLVQMWREYRQRRPLSEARRAAARCRRLAISSSDATPRGAQPTGRPKVAKHKVKFRTELWILCAQLMNVVLAHLGNTTLPTFLSCFRLPYIKKHISGCRICTYATGVKKSNAFIHPDIIKRTPYIIFLAVEQHWTLVVWT